MSAGITLLGAEMLTFSDAAGDRGAFAGPVLADLLPARGGRALVAGPTDAATVEAVAARYDSVDVLVRSFPDAESLRAVLPADVGVFCGPLGRFTGASYDLVVAVAGLDRLHSAEEAAPDPAAVLAQLAGLVAAEGDLLVGIGNVVGLDRLLALAPEGGDADWPEGEPGLEQPTVTSASAVLTAAGLGLLETWCCHGNPVAPTVAAPASLFEERAADPELVRAVGRAYTGTIALKDPVGSARALTRAGLGAAVAPLAILALRRGVTAPAPGRLVVSAGDAGAAPALDPDLADELERRIAAYDLSGAGELLRRHRALLGDDRVLVSGLLDLGADLLGRGVRHPWSPASSAREVARMLAAGAGIEDAEALVEEVAAPGYDVPGNAARRSHAELAALVEELGSRVTQADAHIVWLLQRMQSRQRMLREARARIAELEATRPSFARRAAGALRRRMARNPGPPAPPGPANWTGARNPDLDNREIEAELVPPGYQPTTDAIEIVPTGEPPMDPPEGSG